MPYVLTLVWNCGLGSLTPLRWQNFLFILRRSVSCYASKRPSPRPPLPVPLALPGRDPRGRGTCVGGHLTLELLHALRPAQAGHSPLHHAARRACTSSRAGARGAEGGPRLLSAPFFLACLALPPPLSCPRPPGGGGGTPCAQPKGDAAQVCVQGAPPPLLLPVRRLAARGGAWTRAGGSLGGWRARAQAVRRRERGQTTPASPATTSAAWWCGHWARLVWSERAWLPWLGWWRKEGCAHMCNDASDTRRRRCHARRPPPPPGWARPGP